MFRVSSAFFFILVGLLTASDISRALALRHWRRNEVAAGVEWIRLSTRLNPYSFDARLDQIESLWQGYRVDPDRRYLHEAALIAGGLVRDYPGSALGWAVYSTAATYEATHGGPGYPKDAVLRAVDLDPIAPFTIERAMFLLAAKRRDYATFRALGMKRYALRKERIEMRCDLCGRPWLEHR